MQTQPSHDSFSPAFNPIEPPARDGLTRRDALRSAFAAAGATAVIGATVAPAQPAPKPDTRRASPKRYAMKKSIRPESTDASGMMRRGK